MAAGGASGAGAAAGAAPPSPAPASSPARRTAPRRAWGPVGGAVPSGALATAASGGLGGCWVLDAPGNSKSCTACRVRGGGGADGGTPGAAFASVILRGQGRAGGGGGEGVRLSGGGGSARGCWRGGSGVAAGASRAPEQRVERQVIVEAALLDDVMDLFGGRRAGGCWLVGAGRRVLGGRRVCNARVADCSAASRPPPSPLAPQAPPAHTAEAGKEGNSSTRDSGVADIAPGPARFEERWRGERRWVLGRRGRRVIRLRLSPACPRHCPGVRGQGWGGAARVAAAAEGGWPRAGRRRRTGSGARVRARARPQRAAPGAGGDGSRPGRTLGGRQRGEGVGATRVARPARAAGPRGAAGARGGAGRPTTGRSARGVAWRRGGRAGDRRGGGGRPSLTTAGGARRPANTGTAAPPPPLSPPTFSRRHAPERCP